MKIRQTRSNLTQQMLTNLKIKQDSTLTQQM